MFRPMKVVNRTLPRRLLKSVRNLASDLHEDNNGSISIATVFAFLFLTMLFGMVINIGRHADRKVKIQNAADAATYTGASVMARSMNTLTFTNYLLCDVFALTAYLREARDRNAEATCQPILDKWDDVAPDFRDAPLPKFSRLFRGVPGKTNLERRLIFALGEYNAAISEKLLPVMETILAQEMIPEFQRALAAHTPDLANMAANEIAGRHGPVGRGLAADTVMNALMWRTDGGAFGSATTTGLYALPVADPVGDWSENQTIYFDDAVLDRAYLAQRFLKTLNKNLLYPLDSGLRIGRRDKFVPPQKYYGGYGYHNGAAKLSQYANLWRGFTNAHLKQLLEEDYPYTNLPFQIRIDPQEGSDMNGYVEKDYMFVGVAYWKQMRETMPGLFTNPTNNDQLGFAQARIFIPDGRPFQRVEYAYHPELEFDKEIYYGFHNRPAFELGTRQGPPIRNLWNQVWAAQLVPATTSAIPGILQSTPEPGVDAPSFGGLTVDEFRRINTH